MADPEPTLALRPRRKRNSSSQPKASPKLKRAKRPAPSALNIREILKKMIASPTAHAFREPPNPEDFPDYESKVDHIDLAMVQTNMRDGLYRDNEVRFASDMRRIWNNALEYFPPTNLRYQLAQTNQKDFELYLEKLETQRNPLKRMEDRVMALERKMAEVLARIAKNDQKRVRPPSAAELQRLSALISRLPEQHRKGLVALAPLRFTSTTSGACELDLGSLTREEYDDLRKYALSKGRKHKKQEPVETPGQTPPTAEEDYTKTVRRGQAQLMQAKGADSDSSSSESSSEGECPSVLC